MSKTEDEFENIVGALALELHNSDSEDLTCDVPKMGFQFTPELNTPDYQVEGEKLRFTSLEARNRIVSTHVFKEKRHALGDSMEWMAVAHDLWRHEIGNKDSAAGRFLALIHETNDVCTIAAAAISSKTIKVFDALQIVASALPYLKSLSAEEVWKLCEAQHELTKDDSMAGILFSRLGSSLVRFPTVCRSIHERLRSEITDAVENLHPTAVVALAGSSPQEALELSLKDAESQNELLKSMALWTLGRLIVLSLIDLKSLSRVSDVVISNMSSPAERVRRTAIFAAANATPKTDAFVEALTYCGHSADELSLAAITQAVWANFDETKSKSYFPSWLKFLCKLPPNSKGILDQFDHILSRLLKDAAHQNIVFSCLTEWVTLNSKGGPHDDSVPEYFEMSTIELARHPVYLSELVTEWLLADNKKLASAAAGLLRYLNVHGLEKPELSVEKLDTLQPADLLFLARRLLGFVFTENHLLSLSMSFFKTKDAPKRTFPILRPLFIDEVGYDYPNSTIQVLEAADALEDRPEFKAFYSSTTEALRSHMQALDALPRMTELRPPPTLQRQFAKARAKQINKAMMAERKKSIIRQIVTEVPIKAGIGWFSFRDGAYTEPSYLKSISHSVELPRRATLDTVGAELRLWSMSHVTRGDS
jgi:hypothetical protein